MNHLMLQGVAESVDAVLTNPLVLCKILENIFKHGSVKDVKAYRQVCRLWRECSRTFCKQNTEVRMYYYRVLSEFVNSIKLSDPSDLIRHFENFFLCGIGLRQNTNFNVLFKGRGAHIRILKLRSCSFPSQDLFRKVIFKYCSNLHELHIHFVTISDHKSQNYGMLEEGVWQKAEFGENVALKYLAVHEQFKKHTGITWTELFRHFPSLEVLDLTNHLMTFGNYDEAFQVIHTLRQQDRNKLKLTTLLATWTTSQEIIPPIIDLLLNGGLQLKKLSINLKIVSTENCLKQIIHQHGESLKTLELSNGENRPITSTQFECFTSFPLEKLEQLILRDRVFASLAFLEFVPNLKTLKIWNPFSTITAMTNMSRLRNVVLDKCVELEVIRMMPAAELLKLVKFLPNVKRLRMSLNNATFQIVCKHWTNLVSLQIKECKVDDVGFTGFDARTVDRMNFEKMDCVPGKIARRKANITCLKYLQILHFCSATQFPLSECGVKYGVAQLPNLRHLKIGSYQRVDESWREWIKNYPWPYGSICVHINASPFEGI